MFYSICCIKFIRLTTWKYISIKSTSFNTGTLFSEGTRRPTTPVFSGYKKATQPIFFKKAITAFQNTAGSIGNIFIIMASFQRIEKFKHYLSQIIIQVTLAGMYVIVRIALIDGMDHFVFVTYRLAIGSIAVAPFAYILER